MLTPPSPLYLDTLRHSHESHIRATLYEDMGEGTRSLVGTLPVTQVTITYDGAAYVHRSADISYAVDPLHSESRDIIEQISTNAGIIEIEHAVSQGAILPDAESTDLDWVLLATLRVDALSADLQSAERTVAAYDRSILTQEHLLETVQPLNDTYMNLIERLLRQTLTGDTLTIGPGFSPGDIALTPSEGKAITEGSQRLVEMQQLADTIDGTIVNEADGSFTLRKVIPPTESVWTIDAGDEGVLVGALQETSRREQFNAVSITWTPDGSIPDDDWEMRIFLWDNDPQSPTYYDGPFGKRPVFFDEEYTHLPTQAVAEEMARARLALYTGSTRSVEVDAVYNPLLEPGDKITLVFPSSETEVHVIDAVTHELGPSARTAITTRLDRPLTLVGSYVVGSKSGRRT